MKMMRKNLRKPLMAITVPMNKSKIRAVTRSFLFGGSRWVAANRIFGTKSCFNFFSPTLHIVTAHWSSQNV